ncbi:MAG: hypothetical protein ACK5PP_04365 [Acidimicrobiales bacterium]
MASPTSVPFFRRIEMTGPDLVGASCRVGDKVQIRVDDAGLVMRT